MFWFVYFSMHCNIKCCIKKLGLLEVARIPLRDVHEVHSALIIEMSMQIDLRRLNCHDNRLYCVNIILYCLWPSLKQFTRVRFNNHQGFLYLGKHGQYYRIKNITLKSELFIQTFSYPKFFRSALKANLRNQHN